MVSHGDLGGLAEYPPDGVRPGLCLGPHARTTEGLACSADGRLLAVPVRGGVIEVWDLEMGRRIRKLMGYPAGTHLQLDASVRWLAASTPGGKVHLWDLDRSRHAYTLRGDAGAGLAFAPAQRVLATSMSGIRAQLWSIGQTAKLVREFRVSHVWSMAFTADGVLLAVGSSHGALELYETASGRPHAVLGGHVGRVLCVSAHPDGTMASGGDDGAIKLWDPGAGHLLRTLEGHTTGVTALGYLADGRLLASVDRDGWVCLWDTLSGEQVAEMPAVATGSWPNAIACQPSMSSLACLGRPESGDNAWTQMLDVDADRVLGRSRARSVTYVSAKIVLVGESGVGKTGLGWRLTHPEFVEHPSTHGQQFWLLDHLGTTRADGAQCEAVLWDLAGQPDYRLIHALFLDDADLALVLFDAARDDDPLRGVDFWLRQLGIVGTDAQPTAHAPQAILVAARADRGAPHVTTDEITRFCTQRGVRCYVITSARDGRGLEELLAEMRLAIDWETRPTTVTSETFKQIKDYVLGLKQSAASDRVILSPEELRIRLEHEDVAAGFSDSDMLGAVGHLSNHGYVTRLSTSRGEPRILLAPELLNNIASSIVLEARRNPRGLGSLEEERLLSGGYHFAELDALSTEDGDVLLDSAVARFLDRSICFRQTDPLTSRVYLVFPELINLRMPAIDDEPPVADGVAYTATGSVQNLYASLVVLLGYTSTFTRTNQWRDHARYVVGADMVCGFRLEAERHGELDFVLYHGTSVVTPIRTLFQSLFESFLARRNLTVRRFEPVRCGHGHQLNRSAVRELVGKGSGAMFCPDCGERVVLPNVDAPIMLSEQEAADLREERQAVDRRSRFEHALFRLNAYVTQEGLRSPSCFVSHAWGNPDQERWVEGLSHDLVKAGIGVALDRWENDQIGASVPRFVERIASSDRVLVVGTPRYRQKYDNGAPMGGFVVAAEGDLIGQRLLGSEEQKRGILPVLLEGTKEESFPALLHSRVFSDLRAPDAYYERVLGLALSIYRIQAQDPVVAELKRLLDPDAR